VVVTFVGRETSYRQLHEHADERNTVTTATPHVPAITPEAVDPDSAISPMLEFIRAASGGRLLNMHLQMAAAPLVLDQYTSLRRAIGEHAAIDAHARAAIAVAASAVGNGEYTLAVNGMLARRAGWTDEQVIAITDGRSSGDAKVDALLEVVRETSGGDGRVSDAAWAAAIVAGWTTGDLTEAFGYLALVDYCDRFVRYARTEFDLGFAAAGS
jgi:hypothetical protein